MGTRRAVVASDPSAVTPGERVGCGSLPYTRHSFHFPSLLQFHINQRGGPLEVIESLNSHTHTFMYTSLSFFHFSYLLQERARLINVLLILVLLFNLILSSLFVSWTGPPDAPEVQVKFK